MNSEPKVTIVIINWNGLQDTVECLESLMKIEYCNYDIIIVDNGSSAIEAKKIKAIFGRIKVVELKGNLGFANANNIGILIALANQETEYVLLLNNDTVVDPMFLKEMSKIAQNDYDIGILGPKIYYYGDKNRLWYAGGKVNMYIRHTQEAGKIDVGQHDITKKTDYVSGACMLIRRSVFKNIGLLPREYFLGWEDIDFCLAAKRKGYSCMFVPNSRIWHKVSASYKRHNLAYKQVFFGFRNRFIMRYKFLSRPRFGLFIAVQFCAVIPIHMLYYVVVYKDPKRVITMCQGIFAGIKDMRKRKIQYKLE